MRSIILAAAALLMSFSAQANPDLVGVWSYEGTHLTAVSWETGEEFDRVTPAANPRMFIFTESGYYSQLGITGDEQRPLRSESGEGAMGGPKLSNEQRLAEYRPLISEMGTYEVDGNMLNMRPLIDKVPDYMQGDGLGDSQAEFSIDGDVMSFIRTTEAATIRDTYRRVD